MPPALRSSACWRRSRRRDWHRSCPTVAAPAPRGRRSPPKDRQDPRPARPHWPPGHRRGTNRTGSLKIAGIKPLHPRADAGPDPPRPACSLKVSPEALSQVRDGPARRVSTPDRFQRLSFHARKRFTNSPSPISLLPPGSSDCSDSAVVELTARNGLGPDGQGPCRPGTP